MILTRLHALLGILASTCRIALKEMNNPIRFIAADVSTDDMEGVPTPELQITSAVVERAPIDFEPSRDLQTEP